MADEPASRTFRCGSVVYFDFGPPAEDRSDEGALKEKHYAVVVQADELNASPSYPVLLVCGMTSTKPGGGLRGWVEVPNTPQNGLRHTSYLDAKKLYTVRKDRVIEVVGELEKDRLWEVKNWLTLVLALKNV